MHYSYIRYLKCSEWASTDSQKSGNHPLEGNPEHKIAAQECTYRKVWEDDGNIQKVEVEQSATAFFKTIYTRIHVVQVSHTHAPHIRLEPGLVQGQTQLRCMIEREQSQSAHRLQSKNRNEVL